MKAEVAILNGEPYEVYENKRIKKNQKIGEQEHIFTPFKSHVTEGWQWDKDKNGKPKAILGNPQYVVIHVNGTHSFRVILEIDYDKSDLHTGKVVCLGEPIRVYIPIKKFSKDRLQGIRYTTFRKLLTHESTVEFNAPKDAKT
jgi:hypothetical protein